MDFCKWIYSTYILLVIYIEKNEGVAPLYIEPSFLLIEEDFQLLKPLPVSICPGNVKIISGDPTNTFSITPLNSSCSTLRLNKELDADRENWDGSHWESFSIVFSGPRKARATLEVQVVDINDNTPEFINPPTIISISESAPEHSAITKLRTRDPDTGVAGMARFSVENDLFIVDKRKCNNGECWTILRLKKKLDYEKQSVHQVNIIAEDGDPAANRTNKATHTITIHVIDEQDEPPIFVTNLSQAIILDSSTSTGDEVLVLKAVDGDQMTKKRIIFSSYSMDENDFLQVDKLTGSVYLKKKPENDFNLNISIVAQENDSVGMQTKEILQLKSVVMKAVEEQDPNVLKIEGGLGVFGIDKNDDNMTQEILITVLYPELIDYEKYKNLDFYLSSMTARCRVEVEIIDENDNSPRCAHDAFFFYVTENYRPVVLGKVTTFLAQDINDNWPVFTNSRYSIVLDANISPGGVIGSVKAEDADVTSPNNYVRYTSEDGRFRVMDNGELIFTGKGMLSKDSSTEFRVTAFDGGEPVRNSSAVVIINEHKTSMQSELTTEILGNETKHKTEIKWTNSRMPGYHYEIIKATANGHKDSDVLNWVEIDPTSGVIHTRKALSTNEVKQIKLYIMELIIKIVDNSDSTPFFNKDNYKAIISEDVHQGSHLLDVKTSGGDDNSVIRYSLVVLKGPKDVVVIDNDGVIRSKKRLDFETFRSLAGRVIAEDNEGNVAATNFSILLTDANDNRPIFKNHSVFTVYVDESIPIGTIIDLPYPLATDQDSGKNSQLVYFLLGGDGHFDIDPRQVILMKSFDFMLTINQRAHSLTLRCVDNGGDDPKNEVFAAEADNANHTMFRVDDKRQVVVAKSLRGYAGERLCSQMVAKDAGNPPLSNSVQYCITVFPASANHHSPLIVFPKPNSIYYFDENIKYKELLRIKLLEEGEMENIAYKLDEKFKKVCYTTESSLFFFKDPTLPVLYTNSSFDREQKKEYQITVVAYDCLLSCSDPYKSRNDSIIGIITIMDVNDNFPQFSETIYYATVVQAQASPGSYLTTVSAFDPDEEKEGLKYTIKGVVICNYIHKKLYFWIVGYGFV
uniref:CA domain-containing protein n=1 Tax=Heterorhabditis bacteriophora TaxID=37862 RepID=A0A1I7X7G2_HETBA